MIVDHGVGDRGRRRRVFRLIGGDGCDLRGRDKIAQGSPPHRRRECAEQSRCGGESIGNGPAGPAPRRFNNYDAERSGTTRSVPLAGGVAQNFAQASISWHRFSRTSLRA